MGTGFVVGSGANAVYNGAFLADTQDVVVVTVKSVLSDLKWMTQLTCRAAIVLAC